MASFPNQPLQPPTSPPAADTPPEQAPPAPAAEPQPPAPAPVAPFGWDTDRGPTVQGVPFVELDNPHGGYGFGILVGLDLEASHEQGQKRAITGTFPVEYEPIVGSGGAAYYVDLLTGKGWTVALNPEGA